jgi:hypothetical protein
MEYHVLLLCWCAWSVRVGRETEASRCHVARNVYTHMAYGHLKNVFRPFTDFSDVSRFILQEKWISLAASLPSCPPAEANRQLVEHSDHVFSVYRVPRADVQQEASLRMYQKRLANGRLCDIYSGLLPVASSRPTDSCVEGSLVLGTELQRRRVLRTLLADNNNVYVRV